MRELKLKNSRKNHFNIQDYELQVLICSFVKGDFREPGSIRDIRHEFCEALVFILSGQNKRVVLIKH